MSQSPSNPALQAEIDASSRKVLELYHELGKVVVGQRAMTERLLVGLFTGGHVLLEGVPGLAKSLTVSTLARCLHLKFQRIQFTPDLLPADVVGTLIYSQASGKFEVKKGPVFANLVLADEINRSPAKVQSALLEAMQETQVTLGETTFPLEQPFLVLATQNPLEQEGTYPLPEAQIDRFMLKIHVDYPDKAEELEIMRRMARTGAQPEVKPVMDAAAILQIRQLIDKIEIADRLMEYIVNLVLATRNPAAHGLSNLQPMISYGASPRASIALNLGARAIAFLQGRSYVIPEDVKAIAPDVLSHRILLSYEADAEGVTSRQVVAEVLKKIAI
jgi:MoxR-like ATPase